MAQSERITSHQAAAFALLLAAALALVLVPVPPGTLRLGDTVVENRLTAQGTAAAALAAALAGASLGSYLYVFQPRELRGPWRLAVLGALVVLWTAAAKVFLSLTLPDGDRLFLRYMLPLAAAPMLVASLLDGGVALATGAVLAFLAAFAGLHPADARASAPPLLGLEMGSAFFAGGIAGVLAVQRAERLDRYVWAGALVALATFLPLLSLWLLSPDRRGVDLPWMLLSSALGGGLSSVLTAGALVVLGYSLGLTTRVQLMELAQLTHPLLRQLQDRAPGTYHHSLMVSTLAERAAQAVGADALLVRVGCLYHDIGKLAQPAYYVENQLGGHNPHDSLDPEASAHIIVQHVQAGLQLARRHRLPARVRAFIPEHHGTRLVTFFYRKAAAHDPDADPDRFRYPGPRPQSKETAIAMLADSVEAVVRASRDHSPEHIDELVEGVIRERVAEGQLDDCDLTFRDLKLIAESFKATLRGIYHPRIEYPAPAPRELKAQAPGPIPLPYSDEG
ncbi:MAG TPA: HDIG domain-containing protein [Dehalococcoidia bacterium]|nr:HDIG domain-containing protein [Dehalococcoidia bacterium]